MLVGLTGGIGSGKTAVAERLEAFGITTADADQGAREVVVPGSAGLSAILDRFGADLALPDGSLDRKKLRAHVFGEENREQRAWLESLLHPLIGQWIKEQLAQGDGAYSVLVAPLLLETSPRRQVDHIVVVDIPVEIQIERAASRDGQSREDIEKIIAAQMSREDRLQHADSIMSNAGTLADLDAQVSQLHEKLLQLAQK